MLLPLLAPLLAVLLLAALNPGPALSVRLLTGRSRPLPLGLWLAAAGAGGALLSALATGLALRDGSRRSFRPGPETEEIWSQATWAPPQRGADADPQTAGPVRRPPDPDLWPQAGPARAPGEPAPTVSVPFRVIRRASRPAEVATATARVDDPSRSAPAVVDDWQITAEEDDW